ncbi:unnamed protein product [Prorocentrum cordatum]|uniref:Uncharacterized protein n=1 Tax=Prorocentrum cordatum TaxID=2364126 RepID=A0ABN9XX74_9DINO|nr:unnamed protein product [Polarella glacialis]
MSCRLRTQFEPHLLSRDISSDVLVGRFSSFVNLFARYHESNPIALAKYSASSHERQIVCDVLVRTVFVFCALVAISSLCLIFLQDGSLFPLLRYVCSGGASVDPDKWVCECGFANRLINTVCGGQEEAPWAASSRGQDASVPRGHRPTTATRGPAVAAS